MKIIKLISVLMILILLSACAVNSRTIASHATTFNKAVEQANNEMLLLNIVRASKRQPLIITNISSNGETFTRAIGTGSLSIPFGGGATTDNYSISPNASANSGPTVTMNVLDSDKFMKGFLSTTDTSTIKYFIDQGWPPDLIYTLFIRKIEFTEEDWGQLSYCKPLEDVVNEIQNNKYYKPLNNTESNKVIFRNYPGNNEKTFDAMLQFQNLIHTLVWNNEFEITESADVESLGDGFAKNPDYDLNSLIKLNESKLKLGIENNDYYVKSTVINNELNYRACDLGGEPEKQIRTLQVILDTPNKKDAQLNSSIDSAGKSKIFFRSPEAIIYYLGELARYSQKGKYLILKKFNCFDCDETFKSKKLLVVNRGNNFNTSLSVKHDGIQYSVPSIQEAEEEVEATYQTLTLLTQLISLHKSRDNLTTSGTVNLIAR